MQNPKIHLHINDLPDNITLGKELAIDTETMGLNLKRDRLCLLQIKDTSKDVHLIQFVNNNYAAPNLKKILDNKETLKIFHYARFDILAIYKYLGILSENVFCTKIASKLCRTYTDKHSLKELCKELLNAELQKEQQSSDWGATNLTHEQQIYAASDVLYLHKIKETLEARLIREKRWFLAKSCFNFLPSQAILDDLGFDEEKDVFKH